MGELGVTPFRRTCRDAKPAVAVALVLVLILIPPGWIASSALAQQLEPLRVDADLKAIPAANKGKKLSIGRSDTGLSHSVGERPLPLTIVARFQGPGQSSSTSVPQAESQTSSEPAPKKKSGVLKWILIAGAGAAVGIVLATKKSDSGSDPGTSNNPGTITAGPPTVGPPQ